MKHIYMTYALDKNNQPIFESIRIWDNISKAGNYAEKLNKIGIHKFKAEAHEVEQ